jgi:hypothetical protein
MAEKDDIVAEAREDFARAVDAARENHDAFEADIRFALLEDQWPEQVKRIRDQDGRPMLTINKLKAFIKQVVNDARQNKPSIKVHPVDDAADKETAEVMDGLIRNIEYTSNAEVAYDTATNGAVTGGFGYFKINLDYAHDDTFDMDIRIERVSNPLSIYPDPYSTAADSSDWSSAWEVEWMTHDEFETQFGKEAGKIDWSDFCSGVEGRELWVSESQVLVGKWWKREEITRNLCLMSDGQVFDRDKYKERKEFFDSVGITCVKEREAKSWKVTRRIMSGEKELKKETWPGIYIPIVPVYGDEIDVNGKRYFHSLIRGAKDAQRSFNYWRTAAAELVALAPRVPFIGPKGFAKSDPRWKTANSQNHQFLEYDGQVPPQRQPLDSGSAAGSLQEALNASDDIKATIGMYDASLGARSNETSGRAIMARQREGDVSTFHFQDNMARAIRHAGRILLDLIPKVYDQERVIRTIGEDGSQDAVPLKQPVPVMGEDGQPQMEAVLDPNTGMPAPRPVTRIFDLTQGKYDLTVTSGPSFTSRREEAANMMTQFIQAFPAAGPAIGGLVAKAMDWPGADEIAKRLDALLPPQAQGGLPPEVQQAMQQAQQQAQQLQMQVQELTQKLHNKEGELQVKAADLQIKKQEADTHRMEVLAPDPVDHVGLMDAHTRRFEAIKPEPHPHFDPIEAFRAQTERHVAMKPEPPKDKP